jgi:hypothetical protein
MLLIVLAVIFVMVLGIAVFSPAPGRLGPPR